MLGANITEKTITGKEKQTKASTESLILLQNSSSSPEACKADSLGSMTPVKAVNTDMIIVYNFVAEVK